jgi:fatty acid desaturase
MKNKLMEACFAVLAFYLFACGVATTVVLGILLMPVLFITLLFLAVRELIKWKRKQTMERQKTSVGMRINRKVVIRPMPSYQPYKKVA